METPSEGLRVDNQLRSGDGACGSNWKDLINIRLIPDNGDNRLEFTEPCACTVHFFPEDEYGQ